ncbi:amino acid transporter [Purpureocillium lavendulum]|uniref:Amino acid transporter n=1 Tax=Purpureocillium lavendulum TaxID=1247861 RepID=A0AB34FLZ3_9HYPO|nr:amino acid transporter [Purpureocillium lavendulum]
MRSALLSLVALSLSSEALSAAIVTNGQDGVLQLPLKGISLELWTPGRFKRKPRFSIPTVNDLFYTVPVAVGTPATPVSLAFSISTSVTWVNPNCSNISHLEGRRLCRDSGQFPKDFSKTFSSVDRANFVFLPGYGQRQMAFDTVMLGSSVITSQSIGVAINTTGVALGVLGAAAGPSSFDGRGDDVSIVHNMVRQGVTKRRAFSLDLRGAGSTDGSVVFGGIDTRKFSGPLVARTMIAGRNAPAAIMVDEVGVTSQDGTYSPVTEGPPFSASLDTSYSICYLPVPAVERIARYFSSARRHDSVANDGSMYYTVDCRVAELTGSVDFVMGSATIKVPFKELVGSDAGGGSCLLGVAAPPTDADMKGHADFGNQTILGANFLRSVYAVFDWQGREIHLAKSEDCGSNVRALDGSTTLASMVGECDSRSEL